MGSIFAARPRAHTSELPPRLAIKCLRSELSGDPAFERRFRHEAALAIAIDAPGIVRMFELGKHEGELYLAMELVEGWPCSALLAALREKKISLPVDVAVSVFRGLLEGLVSLHGACDPDTQAPLFAVHRDLSPRNFLIGTHGEVTIVDLGLGRSELQDWLTRTGRTMGSPGYMAPEQVRTSHVDSRADIYAAGVTLFELLTREPYIARGSYAEMLEAQRNPKLRVPSSIRSDVPKEIDELLARTLAPNPDDRFASAREALDAAPSGSAKSELATFCLSLLGPSPAFADLQSDVEPEPEPTQVFARRSLTVETAPTLVASDPRAATKTMSAPAQDPATPVVDPRSSPARDPASGAASSQPQGVPGKSWGSLALVAVGSGAVGSVLTAVVLLAARPTTNAIVADPLDESPTVTATRRDPAPGRGTEPPPPSMPRTRPVRPEAPRRTAADGPSTPANASKTVAELARDLSQRAETLKRERPAHAAEIDELLADIAMWSASKEDRVHAELARIGDRLSQLE